MPAYLSPSCVSFTAHPTPDVPLQRAAVLAFTANEKYTLAACGYFDRFTTRALSACAAGSDPSWPRDTLSWVADGTAVTSIASLSTWT